MIGLPTIDIIFETKAVNAIERSEKGIVALILKDDTGTFDSMEYASIDEIKDTDWTTENIDYIKKVFLGTPIKVICERLDTTAVDYNAALARVKNKRWNYLAIPGISAGETTDIAVWIKGMRENSKRTVKAVLPNEAADHEGVINFTTTGIKVGEKEYTTAEYTTRIAGILAGLPFTRSATYYVLSEVESIIEHEEPDSAVDAGELILINDGEKIKIGRGVNSLVSTTTDKSEDFRKIKIVEGMDLIMDDIRQTFEDQYVGKVLNSYDNQVLFITSINAYFKGLQGDILDPSFNNRTDVDVNAQRMAWEGTGVDTSSMNNQEVKEKSFKSKVFLGANVKFLDAMEDLQFMISL